MSNRKRRSRGPSSHFAELPRCLRIDQAYTKAKGHYLYTETPRGKTRVLDLVGGNGTLLLGHNPAKVVNILSTFLRKNAAATAPFAFRDNSARLRKRLEELFHEQTGRNFVATLTDSSSESMELALHHVELERRRRIQYIERDRQRNLTLVRRQMKAQKISAGPRFLRDVAVALKIRGVADFDDAVFELIRHARDVARRPATFMALAHSYHGRTTGALALSYNAARASAFAGYGIKTEFLDIGDVDRLKKRMKRLIEVWYDIEIDDEGQIVLVARPFINIGAIIAEPILYEGGVKPVPAGFLSALREAADKIGCPLVIDESRSGLGWTGEILPSAAEGTIADYYILGGSLGAGLVKTGALMIVRERFVEWSVRNPAAGSTGDDLSCLAALEVIEAISEDERFKPEAFSLTGRKLHDALDLVVHKHPSVYRKIRGRGALLGLVLESQENSESPGFRLLSEQRMLGPVLAGHLLHEEGIRILPCTNAPSTLRIQAPSTLDEKEIKKIATAFDRAAGVVENGNFALLVRYLVGLERTRRSKKSYSSPAAAWTDHPFARKVAFIGHTISAQTFVDWDPSLAEIAVERRDELALSLQRILKPSLSLRRNVRSATGEVVTLHFLGLSLTSRNIVEAYQARDTEWIVRLVYDGIDKAVQLGCSVIGFGGFTAVLTKNCRDIVDDRIATTSGISFTVVAGLEATTKACEDLGIELNRATVGAVGAYTDLCRNYATVLAEDVSRLILIVPPGREDRAVHVASEIYFQAFKRIYQDGPDNVAGIARAISGSGVVKRLLAQPFPAEGTPATVGPEILSGLDEQFIEVTTSMDALSRCDIIISGAPRGRMTVQPSHIKDGPVVICDIALPASVSPTVKKERPDVVVLLGGLVRLPNNPDFYVPGIPLPTGTTFGCMAETMLLGLTGIMEDYSVGQLTQIKIHKIKEIAGIHGFELGHFKTIPSM